MHEEELAAADAYLAEIVSTARPMKARDDAWLWAMTRDYLNYERNLYTLLHNLEDGAWVNQQVDDILTAGGVHLSEQDVPEARVLVESVMARAIDRLRGESVEAIRKDER